MSRRALSRLARPPVSAAADPQPLLAAIAGALDLIRQQDMAAPSTPLPPPAPLSSLLEQCRRDHQQAVLEQRTPLRTIHHLACTGGTLISKCLMAMPNTRLLSEIAPLTTILVDPTKPRFAPSDLIWHMKTGLRPCDRDDIIAVFLAALATLSEQCRRRGERLILRDHAHSQFCVGAEIPDYAPLHHMIAALAPVRGVVTVRHPLESYLSLLNNRWEHHQPSGLDEYCRRYLAFLAAHEDLPRLCYEDFVADPDTVLRQICALLDLPFNPCAVEVFSLVQISGDSGRSGSLIASRPRRAIPESLRPALAESAAYHSLCAKLGYDPR